MAVEKKRKNNWTFGDFCRLLCCVRLAQGNFRRKETGGATESGNVDEALEQSEQQVCKHVIFRERERGRAWRDNV